MEGVVHRRRDASSLPLSIRAGVNRNHDLHHGHSADLVVVAAVVDDDGDDGYGEEGVAVGVVVRHHEDVVVNLVLDKHSIGVYIRK